MKADDPAASSRMGNAGWLAAWSVACLRGAVWSCHRHINQEKTSPLETSISRPCKHRPHYFPVFLFMPNPSTSCLASHVPRESNPHATNGDCHRVAEAVWAMNFPAQGPHEAEQGFRVSPTQLHSNNVSIKAVGAELVLHLLFNICESSESEKAVESYVKKP